MYLFSIWHSNLEHSARDYQAFTMGSEYAGLAQQAPIMGASPTWLVG